MREVTLPIASLVNPIDLTASGTDEQAEAVTRISVLGKLTTLTWQSISPCGALPQNTDSIGQAVSNAIKRTGKPIIVATDRRKGVHGKEVCLRRPQVPVFLSLERAAHVAMHLVRETRDKHNN